MNDQERIQYFKEQIARLSNQVVDLQNERDALEAQVEALATNRDAFREAAYKAISIIQVNNIRLPQGYGDECLAEIRAESIESAVTYLTESIPDKSHESVIFKDRYVYISNRYLREYAAKVRQGGE